MSDPIEDPDSPDIRKNQEKGRISFSEPLPLAQEENPAQAPNQIAVLRDHIVSAEASSSKTTTSGSRKETRQQMLSLCDSLLDSAVANCNRRYWLQNLEGEAKKLWCLGKELGTVFEGNEDEIVERLIEMEK